PDVNPRVLKPAPNIRYTIDNDWLILKGRGAPRTEQDPPEITTPDLCRTLVGRNEFSGAAFSLGDGWISQCASGAGGNGNATTWTQMGTSHHLEFVRSQIASICGT